MTITRRVWAELRFAHPDVDPADPSDEFAVALLEAAGFDPTVWERGGQGEAITAYRRALAAGVPDHTWATGALKADPNLAVEVRLCNTLGISHDTFLDWSDRSQDLAIAALLSERDTCAHGHPREAMNNPDLVVISRVHCAVCAKVHDLDEQFRDAPADYTVGWHTEVSPR